MTVVSAVSSGRVDTSDVDGQLRKEETETTSYLD